MTQIAHFISLKSMSGYGDKNAGKIPHERVKVGDEEFDSLAEKDRYLELLVMEKGGIISDLKCHPAWELIPTQKVPGKIHSGSTDTQQTFLISVMVSLWSRM